MRLLAGLLVALASVLACPGSAAADPATPTNDRSDVLDVVPSVEGVHVEVVGGDAFLRIAVEPGRVVSVPGYEGEAYLRITADGRVERNERSPAVWLNSGRFGPTEPEPAASDAGAAPEWRAVATGGEYVWHDHRIHAMGGEPAQTWEVPMEVDGSPVVVRGTLTRLAAPSAVPWIVVVVIAAALVLALMSAAPTAGVVAVILVALGTLAVGAAEAASLPGEARPGPLGVALPVVALVASGLALVLRRRTVVVGPLVAGAGIALVMWSVRRWSVIDHAVLLTSLPAAVDRAAVAAAMGTGVAAVVAGTLHAMFGRMGLRRRPAPVAH